MYVVIITMIWLGTMTDAHAVPLTPWRKVFAKFGGTRSAFARAIGRDKSKIARHLTDDKGLISGNDQVLLIAVAKGLGVELTAEDLTPDLASIPAADVAAE